MKPIREDGGGNPPAARYSETAQKKKRAIKKQVLNDLGNYDENFYFAQDFMLFSKMIKQGYKIKYLSEVFYEINMKENISTNFLKQQNYYANCVKKNIKPETIKDHNLKNT